MNNKRGDIPWLVLMLIAGLIAITILILGLTGTWKSLAFWIPKDNIQTLTIQCSALCTQQDVYNFCTSSKELKVNATTTYIGTCKTFASKEAKTSGNVVMPTNQNFGVESCSGLCS